MDSKLHQTLSASC